MDPLPRPVLVLSRCLELEACRYNGEGVRSPIVARLLPFVDLHPICPEVEIGLGVPRDPIRLVQLEGENRLIQPSTGRDLTIEMGQFTDRFLSGMSEADGFILKARSPSCGIKDTKIYGGVDGTQPSGKGAGMFGAAVLARFPHAAIEDEGRLTNFRLRHHFLTKLFALARLRAVSRAGSVSALASFHAEHKLVLMAYHQSRLRELGRMVADAAQRPFAEAWAHYFAGFARALATPPRHVSHTNVLHHALGYFSDELTRGEKRHFLALVDEYRAKRATLAAPLAVLQSWIARFAQPYLHGQRYFLPYPTTLMDLKDSGAGR